METEIFYSLNKTELTEIVVPLDEGAAAQRALATATRIAQRLHLPLHLVNVQTSGASAEDFRRAEHVLQRTRTEVLTTNLDIGPVDIRVVAGDETACALCDAYPTAVVVMGTDHAASRPISPTPSTAEAMIRHSQHHPLVVIGPNVTSGWRDGAVVVTLDGSPVAESALPAATGWAKTFGAPLELVQVVPLAAARTSAQPPHSAYLQAVHDHLRRENIDSTCTTLVGDDPIETISAHLARSRSSLAVMSTHASTGVEREAFGSVTLGVIATSPCPVRVVRPTRLHRPILG